MMAIFRSWRGRFIAGTVLVVLAWGAGVIDRQLIRPRGGTAFQELALGESRDRLLDLAGSPDGNASVTVRTAEGKLESFQELHYQGFYQTWTFAFDGHGRLVRKNQCVLEEYCSEVK